MSDCSLLIRRARRTDFSGVLALFAASDLPVPPPDRRTLRRFRQLVSDLAGDLYVAVADDRIVGLVHNTYSRALLAGQRADIERLLVSPEHRGAGVGSRLLAFATKRARKRGCEILTLRLPPSADRARAWCERGGLVGDGEAMVARLAPMD